MTEGPYKLPEGWRWVRLGEVANHRSGIWGPEAADPMNGFPVVRSTEIHGMFIKPQTASVRKIPHEKVSIYKLESGDILVNKSSGSPHLVGWPALFMDPYDGKTYLFSNFMMRIKVDSHTIEPFYLLDYLHSPIARQIYLGAQDTTSGLRNLRVKDFMAQPIPLPPLGEQRRIVARIEELMARIREARRLREQAREDAERLSHSVLADTFPRPGSDLPPGWRWVRLGEVAALKNGRAYKRSDWSSEGVPIIRIQNLNSPERPFNYWNGPLKGHVIVNTGTVLISWSGTPGTSFGAHIWNGPLGVLNQHIFRVDFLCNDITPSFAVAAVNVQLDLLIKASIGGVGLRHVTKRQVESLNIPLPPLAEQRRIVAHLQAVQEKIRALKAAQAETDEHLKRLEQSILDKAFRGEL